MFWRDGEKEKRFVGFGCGEGGFLPDGLGFLLAGKAKERMRLEKHGRLSLIGIHWQVLKDKTVDSFPIILRMRKHYQNDHFGIDALIRMVVYPILLTLLLGSILVRRMLAPYCVFNTLRQRTF